MRLALDHHYSPRIGSRLRDKGHDVDAVVERGLVFTSDASMARSRETIGRYVVRLDRLLRSLPRDDALIDQVRWL